LREVGRNRFWLFGRYKSPEVMMEKKCGNQFTCDVSVNKTFCFRLIVQSETGMGYVSDEWQSGSWLESL